MRFPCCGKCYPCDKCHEEAEDGHEMEQATRMICGFCSKEQVKKKVQEILQPIEIKAGYQLIVYLPFLALQKLKDFSVYCNFTKWHCVYVIILPWFLCKAAEDGFLIELKLFREYVS